MFKMNSSQSKVMAAIYLVFGLLLCFFSTNILITSTRVIGGILTLYGIWQLYVYFGRRNTTNASSLFVGVPCILFGLVMLVSPESLISIFPVVGGIILIVNSLIQMQKSFVLKDYGFENWVWAFFLSLALLVAGVVILLKPVQSLSFILQLIGVCLIVECVMILFNEYELGKYLPGNRKK